MQARKILVIGERYSANLGDPIICESVYYLLKKKDSRLKIDFLDLSGRQDYQAGSDSLRQARLSGLKRKVSTFFTGKGLDTDYLAFKKYHDKNKAYFRQKIEQGDYDLAVFAGGQIFMDYFVFPIQTVVDSLAERNIPVIFNACGSGEITSKRMRTVLGQSLSRDNVRVISGRDDLEAIRSLLDKKEPELIKTHDPALWAGEVYGVTRKKSSLIGLGIMFAYNMEYKEQLDFWTGLIRTLDRQSINWQLFCNGCPRDYSFARQLLISMNFQPEEISERLLAAPGRPEELVEIIAGFRGIISFRLHSHVVAAALDVPGIAVRWDKKLDYFFDSLDLPDRVFAPDAENGRLLKALDKALDQGYKRDLIESYKKDLQAILLDNIF